MSKRLICLFLCLTMLLGVCVGFASCGEETTEEVREDMLTYAHERLAAEGYLPYYLYRQKHTSGSTENMGFCKNDTISAYNVRIMEEAQSILAIGAGGISKVYYPEENRLERVANVSNYEIYIERIDEMIQRKENNFWR